MVEALLIVDAPNPLGANVDQFETKMYVHGTPKSNEALDALPAIGSEHDKHQWHTLQQKEVTRLAARDEWEATLIWSRACLY